MGRKEQERCQHYREQLVKDRERLADLEERGDAACSAYDLHFGYDAVFNIQLKRNHIAYDLKQLETCPPPVQQTTLFDAFSPAPDAHLESDYDERNGDIGE